MAEDRFANIAVAEAPAGRFDKIEPAGGAERPDRFGGIGLPEPAVTEGREPLSDSIIDDILFSPDRTFDALEQGQIASELLERLSKPEETEQAFENRMMLSSVFGVPLEQLDLMEPTMLKQLFEDDLVSLKDRFQKNPVEGGFFKKMGEAVRRGNRNVSSDIAVYQAAYENKGDIHEVLRTRSKHQLEESLSPIEGTLITNLFYKSGQIVPGMVRGYWDAIPEAFTGMVAGITIAGIAGQVGPQVLLPEEVVTVPVGAVVGLKTGLSVGSAHFWYKQGAGTFFAAMMDKDVDPEVARTVAGIAAVPYAIVELLQVQALTPGLRKGVEDIGRRTMLKVIAQATKTYGSTFTQEVLEEIAQEIIQISAEDIAEFLSDNDIKLDARFIQERAARVWTTAKESAQALALLPIPGAAIDVATGRKAVLSQQRIDAINAKTAEFEQALDSILPESVRKEAGLQPSAEEQAVEGAAEPTAAATIAKVEPTQPAVPEKAVDEALLETIKNEIIDEGSFPNQKTIAQKLQERGIPVQFDKFGNPRFDESGFPILPEKAATVDKITEKPATVDKIAEKGRKVDRVPAEAEPTAKKPKNIAEARDIAATEWAQSLAETIEPGDEIFIPPQVNRIFTFRGKERSTLIPTSPHLRAAGLEPGSELNRWRKPEAPAAAELIPLPGETKDQFRARVRAAKGIKIRPKQKAALPPPAKPSKAEQQIIDAKKFNQQIREHQAAVKGEGGAIDTESVDQIDEPLGRTMTPEWYEANTKKYKKTVFEKGSEAIQRAAKGIDKVLGSVSTRLNKISPELFRRTRRHVFNVMTRTTEQARRVEPFIKLTKKLDKKTLAQLDLAFKNSDGKKITQIAAENGMSAELKEVRQVLDELYNAGNAVGLGIDYRKNYMPRVVKDTKGFLEFFQKGDDWSIIRTVIENKESQRGRALTETERAAAVNTLLRGYRTSALALTAPGAAKARTVETIDAELNLFYHDFRTSLTKYIRTMNEKIASREFFGRQSKEITKLRAQQSAIRTRLAKLSTRQRRQKPADAGKELRIGFLTTTLPDHIARAKDKFDEITEKLDRMGADDLSNTVGNFVIDLVTNEEIKPSQEKDVRDLLMSMFDPQGTHGLIGDIIALTYIDVLGSPLNAITQLEELGLAFYRSPLGFVPEAVKAALNLSDITVQDIGVTSVGQEFADADFKKALSAIMGVTGFEKIDRTGKQTFINTVIRKMRSQARKPDKTFMDRLQRVFGKETDQVIADLKSGEVTDNIKYLAFNQLLDIQPVAISEMPEAYNRAGNLRILWTLKTFMAKQLDFVRNEAFADMKSADTFMRGFGRLVWLAFSISLFGAGADALKDFLRGRPFDWKDSVIDTFLRRIFFSKFQATKALQEGFGRAFLEGFIPPTKLVDGLTKDMKNAWKDPEKFGQFMRSVPIVGELYFWWFGQGREKALKEQKKARRDSVRRKPLFTGVKD